jgi:hypothetical protein
MDVPRAHTILPDKEEGRYVVRGYIRLALWEVILEPDMEEGIVVVVTAYPLEE